jgi:recombination protein RecA
MANIDVIIKEIEKQFGEGAAMILDDAVDLDIERVSSGSLNLDMALGGGLPVGRTIEFFGPESGGKTTCALLTIAEFQKKYPDKYAAFLDIEHAFNPEMAKKYGIDTKRLFISQPDTAEAALDLAEYYARTGIVCIIVIDSVSALVPQAEADESMEKQTIGLQARLMSKALRKLTPPSAKNNCSIIFINQIREKVGVLYGPKIKHSELRNYLTA